MADFVKTNSPFHFSIMSAIVGAFMSTDVESIRTESKYFHDIKPIIFDILYNVQDNGKPDYHPRNVVLTLHMFAALFLFFMQSSFWIFYKYLALWCCLLEEKGSFGSSLLKQWQHFLWRISILILHRSTCTPGCQIYFLENTRGKRLNY